MLGDFGFVNKKRCQADESEDERRENAPGRPGVLGASPSQPDDNGSRGPDHESIPSGYFQCDQTYWSESRAYIQSTRASFSRAVPGGVGTRRQVNIKTAAAPQIGMSRSMWFQRDACLADAQENAQKNHLH
jgi:hypothetical protein